MIPKDSSTSLAKLQKEEGFSSPQARRIGPINQGLPFRVVAQIFANGNCWVSLTLLTLNIGISKIRMERCPTTLKAQCRTKKV
jgi:hypothetical protein